MMVTWEISELQKIVKGSTEKWLIIIGCIMEVKVQVFW